VTLLPRTPAGRITLAISLSLLVHIVMLLAPLVKLPPGEPPLPPLVARLEPLPAIAAPPIPRKIEKPKAKPKTKPKPAQSAKDTTPPPDNPPADNIQSEPPQTDPEPQPPATDKVAEETQQTHALPRHAQLTFIAYKGVDFEIGEARHRLEVNDDNSYLLKVDMNTTGLASVFKTFESSQQSSGTLTQRGLRPNNFSETRNTAKGKGVIEAKFVWEDNLMSFSNNTRAPLPEQSQDIISFLYQLSQLPLGNGVVPMHISNGKKLERYELAIGEEEEIETRLGKLRALPLRKVYTQGEEGLDIWLGLEYRLLPVKIRQINRSGEIAGEMVVSDIRVSD